MRLRWKSSAGFRDVVISCSDDRLIESALDDINSLRVIGTGGRMRLQWKSSAGFRDVVIGCRAGRLIDSTLDAIDSLRVIGT